MHCKNAALLPLLLKTCELGHFDLLTQNSWISPEFVIPVSLLYTNAIYITFQQK